MTPFMQVFNFGYGTASAAIKMYEEFLGIRGLRMDDELYRLCFDLESSPIEIAFYGAGGEGCARSSVDWYPREELVLDRLIQLHREICVACDYDMTHADLLSEKRSIIYPMDRVYIDGQSQTRRYGFWAYVNGGEMYLDRVTLLMEPVFLLTSLHHEIENCRRYGSNGPTPEQQLELGTSAYFAEGGEFAKGALDYFDRLHETRNAVWNASRTSFQHYVDLFHIQG